MENNSNNKMQGNQGLSLAQAQQSFMTACEEAGSINLANNAGAAFMAAGIVGRLREALSDAVMANYFMPLMNTKVGFLTDKPGYDRKTGEVKPTYPISVVRDAIIDAAFMGLLPTGNQFNIISERMYPTKEGFTSLLKKIGCRYFISLTPLPDVSPSCAAVCCKINYEWQGEKNGFTITATVKKDGYSSMDQIKGKAERQAKKKLYEYLTGCDFGEADEDSSIPEDQTGTHTAAVEAKKVEMRKTTASEAPKLL